MSGRSNQVLLQHMVEAAREALLFARGKTRRDLVVDRQFALAVVKCIEIVGEAAYQVPQATREQFPEVPWDQIIGTRHRLVHDYSQIDYDVIWRIVQDELPLLIETIERGGDRAL